MEIESFSFNARAGWKIPELPALDSKNTLVLAFGAPSLGEGDVNLEGALGALARAYPTATLFGCSTAGEIHDSSIDDGSLSVAVVRFDRTPIRFASAAVDTSSDSFAAGEAVARELAAPDLRAVTVLSDGTNVNGSELIRGINAVLPASVVVTGGLAGDGSRFKRTWVLDRGRPVDRRVAAVGFYGDRVGVGHGSQGGWDIFGPERTVTKSEGNVLYEIDDKPALELYKHYLGDQAAGLPSTALLYPLALRASKTSEKTLVRTILAVDDATNSLTFAGDIPKGSLVKLMRANFDRLIGGAANAAVATTARSATPGKSIALAISCVGRRLVLGERAEEEVEAVLRALPEGARLVGFYSYGEISPYATGACDLHNQTMTLTNIWES